MLHVFKLLIPALIPSWNFFDVIVPSPRIQYAIVDEENNLSVDWQEFRPRPVRVSLPQMVIRMVWNPFWNESLFIMSCAERLMDYPTQHSEDEIFKRIKADIISVTDEARTIENKQVKFRLIFIQREGENLKEQIRYESQVQAILRKSVK